MIASTILFVHLLTMTTIVFSFLSKTKFSMLGESWHTVAQLNSECTKDILAKSSFMTDKEVEEYMRKQALDKQLWNLKYSRKDKDHLKVVKVS
jgi:hypothetical protein